MRLSIHVEAVLSIDEMWAWLPFNLREPATVEAIGRRIKETVARDVSPVIKVSVGAGPNKYLAKMASKMRKPDALFILEHAQLPDILHPLKFRGESWAAETRTAETDSTLALMRLLDHLWHARPEPRRPILQVGGLLTRLCEHGNHTPELFEMATHTTPALDVEKHQRLDAALDQLRARYGRKVIYFGSVQESRDAAPMRISFTHIPELGLEQD